MFSLVFNFDKLAGMEVLTISCCCFLSLSLSLSLSLFSVMLHWKGGAQCDGATGHCWATDEVSDNN